jgi:NADH:ubiquinone oxidoreductase subunit 5 (subunit L)/multisubunit Na+/H+ antiporter MnhA subunit
MKVGNLNVSFAYQVDQLSIIMALIVTGVGFIIHVYSIGYMHGDKSFWRFFAYLNLFIFAMMNLYLLIILFSCFWAGRELVFVHICLSVSGTTENLKKELLPMPQRKLLL